MNNKDKKYRQLYQHYITNNFAQVHNLDQIEKFYQKSYYLWKSYFSPFIKNFSRQKSKVLDIGCGLGQNLYVFKKLGFKNVLGVDISPEIIAFVKKQGFSIQQADVFKFLKNKAKQYQIITLFDVVEHLTIDEAINLLKLIRRALTENGIVIIHTFNAGHPFCNYTRYCDITHKTGFTIHSLDMILREAGLKKNTIFTFNPFYIWHPNPFIYLLRRVIFLGMAKIGEIFYLLLALSQGLTLKECKYNLAAISQK